MIHNTGTKLVESGKLENFEQLQPQENFYEIFKETKRRRRELMVSLQLLLLVL